MEFSPKQRRVLTWWRPGSPDRDKQAIICDGAVRSGKTLCTGLSFFCWAMQRFQNRRFALCGRTIVSVRRNLLEELLPLLEGMGFRCRQKTSQNLLEVRLGRRKNTFYLFGGKDEGSAALIQGLTLAGALLDEVALMPRSFVEQAAAAFPLLICGLFVVSTLIKNRNFTNKKNRNLFYKINVSDLYGVVLPLCAMGLILIPEIVYVRDIYEKTAPRANTMFKLTYQAYILFALMMSYILVFFVADRIKILQETKLDNRYEKKVRLSKVQITVGGMAIILLISTCGYFVNATTNWFTGFPLKNKYQTLNATAYIENAIPEDAAAIRWLNKNITGQPTVLEACGDSYKDYDNRVSAMTGLPTVLGWYVHEWLWRNNLDEENKRRTDVETIYTSTDKKEVQELLDKYEVNYIFIGSCEYQKYEGVNVALLSSLGEIVFKKENTMIVKL